MYRNHNCGELNINNVGEEVVLAGWIQRIRNLGAMKFIDLRDQFGITQIVISDNEDIKKQAEELVTETVIQVTGNVLERSSKNNRISTGEIEIDAKKIVVLGKCKNTLPFEVNSEKADISAVREDLRLEYRFLDLRNEKLHNTILLRSKVLKTLRDKMDELGFSEIQTPILANSSPEGARDFLVPSRLHPGEFYALPQAPQQFKQLLMVSGFDKYFQIAPCFRDEDPRADRAPGEFYQLDFEMSFAEQEDVFKVLEEIFISTFRKHTNWKVEDGPFIRIPYKEAMEKYGIDKPDLRNPLIIQDATELFASTEFNAFKDKTIKVIVVPNGADQGRKFFDNMSEFAVTELGAKGLAWTKFDNENNVNGGISKFITDDVKTGLQEKLGVKPNDSLFFIADDFETAQKIAGGVRIELGNRLDLLEKNCYKFCLIVDFPMYELAEEEIDGEIKTKIDFNHNPFSMPQGGMEALLNKDPLEILAYQFDFVCNGNEMASGAIRNTDLDSLVKGFEVVGYTKEDVEKRFNSLFTAFKYGCPPHGGMAPGIDRLIMLIQDEPNLREVQAFPASTSGQDLMMGSPSTLEPKQLEELGIKIKEE